MSELAMILAGGQGKRLYPLSRDRAKPAVPMGGRYRIIDFVLSNFINSGFFKIKVLVQFKSNSLIRHISLGWRLSPHIGHYIDMVPAQMQMGKTWYRGTADAIYQNMNLIEDENPDHIFIFGGDHVYKMDVRQMFDYHLSVGAELTIATLPKPVHEATSMGVVQVDKDLHIVGFEEKPARPKEIPGRPGFALVSMGNYIFNRVAIVEQLRRDSREKSASHHDFGKDIIPKMIASKQVYAYDFTANRIPGMNEKEIGYWRDVGSIEEYFKANMDLVEVTPKLNLYNSSWPIRTTYLPFPPAKFVFANEPEGRVGYATDSLVSEGCIISGGHVHRSILSPAVRINSFAEVTDSILMEGVDIGRHCKIKNAIIDKEVNLPARTEIGYDLKKDKKRFFVTQSGIVVVPKKAVVAPD